MSAYRTQVLQDNPNGYWRLGEASGVFADSSGKNHPATGSGGVTYGAAGATIADNAVTLTVSSGLLTVTDHADFDFGDVFTLEAWFNRSGTIPSDSNLVKKGANGYQFYQYGAGGIGLNKDSSSVIVQSLSGSPANSWHHGVVTKNAATVKLYLDGFDVTGTVTNAVIADTAVDLTIGLVSVTTTVDEVAVYPTALSMARVQAHYYAAQQMLDSLLYQPVLRGIY